MGNNAPFFRELEKVEDPLARLEEKNPAKRAANKLARKQKAHDLAFLYHT